MDAVTDPKNQIITINLLDMAFKRRGYQRETFRLAGRLYSRFTGPDGWMWLTPNAFVSYPMVTYAAIKICATKDVAYEFAAQQGLSIPQTLQVPGATPEQVQAFLAAHAPLVVKPVHSHGSIGLSLGVDTPEKLSQAIETATVDTAGVLLQRQFTGDEVRFMILHGKVIAAILRQTPQVTGDGIATVAELISRENEARAALSLDYIVYPQLSEALVGDHMHSQTVPAEGEVVELSKSTLVRGGSSLYNITDTVHASYKQTAVKLAAKLNPEFLVVDMMIADYTAPQTDDNYVFIECNTSPSLRLFYGTRDGKIYDIADKLVDAIIDKVAFPK